MLCKGIIIYDYFKAFVQKNWKVLNYNKKFIDTLKLDLYREKCTKVRIEKYELCKKEIDAI